MMTIQEQSDIDRDRAENAALREAQEQVKAVFLSAGCSDFTDDLAEMARAFCDTECKEWREKDDYQALRARSIPALTWIRENGESAADHGCFRLEVFRSHRHASALRWKVYASVDVVAEGPAESQADGEAKAEAALLVACNVGAK